MATQNTIQVINHEVPDETGSNKVFHDKDLRSLIASCDAPNDPYPVISIIGAQSSGKSTLMNKIFNLKFDEMNAGEGRRQCTKGIWVGICNSPRAVVMDIEGTDGVEAQDDLGFENRSALFALVVSDVIFVNMFQGNVGLVQGIPLLTNIFQERAKKVGPQGLPELHQTRIVFTVRDYDGMTPKDKFEKKLTTMVYEIWKNVPQAGDIKFEKYFKLDVEFFPHLVYREDDFVKKCVETRERIASGHYGNQRLSGLPVRDFPSDAKELWDKIVQNKRLDLPSQREMRARASCSAIMSELFHHFQSSNKEYQELVNARKDNPREFDDQLKSILDNILSEYDNQTQIYGSDIIDEMKKTLVKDIIHHAEPEFRSVMARFKTTILDKTEIDIQLRSGESVTEMKERASSVVRQYREEFMSNYTTGLKFDKYYHIDQENFLERLDLHVKAFLAEVELSARKSSSIIESKLFQQFQSNNKEYRELKISVRNNPREFDDRFKQILDDVLSEYDNKTKFCGRDIANETREMLKIKILQLVEPALRTVMLNFKTAILDKAKSDIPVRCGDKTNGIEQCASSVVSECHEEFMTKTVGLNFYSDDMIQQEKFWSELDSLSKTLTSDIKSKNAWKRVASAATTIGLAAATGGPGGALAAAALQAVQELVGVVPQTNLVGGITDLISAQNGETSNQKGASPSSPRFK